MYSPSNGRGELSSVPQSPHPHTAAHHTLPLMTKSHLMTDLTLSTRHQDVIFSSWELPGGGQDWRTGLCMSPREGEGVPSSPRPLEASSTQLGRLGLGCAWLVRCTGGYT